MKSKPNIISIILLLLLSIVVVLYITQTNNLTYWEKSLCIGAYVFVVIGVVIYKLVKHAQKKLKEQEEAQKEHLKSIEEEKIRQAKSIEEAKRIARNNYISQRNSIIEKYGYPDKEINAVENDINADIYVYEKTESIIIQGKEIHFKELISCKVVDTPTVIKGNQYAIASTNTEEAITRSLIGGVVFGAAGAVVGGATANRYIQYYRGNDYSVHDFTVVITLNDISNSVIRIHVGNNEYATNEIVGLLTVIISRNN